jgi:hypothetical protein
LPIQPPDVSHVTDVVQRRFGARKTVESKCRFFDSLFPDISLSMLMLLLRHREVSIVEQAEERRKISILPKKEKRKKKLFFPTLLITQCAFASADSKKK